MGKRLRGTRTLVIRDDTEAKQEATRLLVEWPLCDAVSVQSVDEERRFIVKRVADHQSQIGLARDEHR